MSLVFEFVRNFAQFLLVLLYLPSQRVILFFVLRASTKCLESLSERFSARLVELVQQSVLVVAKLANVKIELLNLLLVLVGSHWLFVLPVDQKSVLVNPICVGPSEAACSEVKLDMHVPFRANVLVSPID